MSQDINNINRFLDSLCFEESLIYKFLFSDRSATSFFSDVLSNLRSDVERIKTLNQLLFLLNENSQDRIIEFFHQNELSLIPIQPNKYLTSSFTFEEEEAYNHELMINALSRKENELIKLKEDNIPKLIQTYTKDNKNSVVKGLNYVGNKVNLLNFRNYLVDKGLIEKADDETFFNIFSEEFTPNSKLIHWNASVSEFKYFIKKIKESKRCSLPKRFTINLCYMFSWRNKHTGIKAPITKENYTNHNERINKNIKTFIDNSIKHIPD
ncbi:hypothetical protein E0W68_12450 [Flavobacterium salilacus subsp. salilacus]|uniref:hypothetical protein n=1 Tax=Flavobacterium TaxID=237 RepID=UPI0010754DBA|nr:MULTISPECIES: hypothetical protein [Flavobacterium]KAF2516335.1 hypothetical protein E0W68_12450 [Flavobacterium salilacus subsp. salilacus]MBE1613867.1 hypothetical protein [Flavobacterium sp. SaA2.13]